MRIDRSYLSTMTIAKTAADAACQGPLECLSSSARTSCLAASLGAGLPRTTLIERLMREHNWTHLCAWRHAHGYSKSEVASRLGVHRMTYELIEDGTVDLGPWLAPALEWILVSAIDRKAHPNRR
ncbi:hypothetical protein [Achromobacter marplatensis]|uniref:hypothetical protein n=1 Tax=Achromobacter marplatensis TaxID=470868 RepID=UPI0039F6A006